MIGEAVGCVPHPPNSKPLPLKTNQTEFCRYWYEIIRGLYLFGGNQKLVKRLPCGLPSKKQLPTPTVRRTFKRRTPMFWSCCFFVCVCVLPLNRKPSKNHTFWVSSETHNYEQKTHIFTELTQVPFRGRGVLAPSSVLRAGGLYQWECIPESQA